MAALEAHDGDRSRDDRVEPAIKVIGRIGGMRKHRRGAELLEKIDQRESAGGDRSTFTEEWIERIDRDSRGRSVATNHLLEIGEHAIRRRGMCESRRELWPITDELQPSIAKGSIEIDPEILG
jgi:hypothetical protein